MAAELKRRMCDRLLHDSDAGYIIHPTPGNADQIIAVRWWWLVQGVEL